MIKLSIIIPFKNSEKSIIKTLDSIKRQNANSNFYEVLLINDFQITKPRTKLKNTLVV